MAANLLAHSSDGMFTGMGFDGWAALSDGLLAMLTVPVPPPPPGSLGSGGPNLWKLNEPRRQIRRDDAELVVLLQAIWGLLR